MRLDALEAAAPGRRSGGNRNPFRFYDAAAAAAAAGGRGKAGAGPVPPPEGRRSARAAAAAADPAEVHRALGRRAGQGKIAAFSDCRTTMRGREGDIIAGQYRLVRIGVESVVMEYVDGRGRTTIRMSGQECVGK